MKLFSIHLNPVGMWCQFRPRPHRMSGRMGGLIMESLGGIKHEALLAASSQLPPKAQSPWPKKPQGLENAKWLQSTGPSSTLHKRSLPAPALGLFCPHQKRGDLASCIFLYLTFATCFLAKDK